MKTFFNAATVSKAAIFGAAFAFCVNVPQQAVRAQNAVISNASTLPSFDFLKPQNLEAFGDRRNITSMRQTSEGLEIVSGGHDPFFFTPPLDLLPGEPLLLHIRARCANAGFFQIYFFAEGDGPSEGRSVRLNVNKIGVWEDLRVPMPTLGPRTRFRFDLPDGAGLTTISTFAFETQSQALGAMANAPQPTGRVLANDFHRLVIGKDGAILSWQARLGANRPFSRNLIQRLAWDRTTSLPPGTLPQGAWRWKATPTTLTATDDIGNRLRIELRNTQLVFALRPAAREYSPTTKSNAVLLENREGARLKFSVPFLSGAGEQGGITGFAVTGKVVSLKEWKGNARIVEIDAENSQNRTRSLRFITQRGFEIVADSFSSQAPIRFSPGFFSSAVQQEMPPGKEHVFAARVQPLARGASTR